MTHDSVADVLGDLEDSDSENYLNKLPERISNQIRELLSYPEDSAGGIMNSDVITVDKDMTVDEVVSFLRIKAETDKVELLYVYVTDKPATVKEVTVNYTVGDQKLSATTDKYPYGVIFEYLICSSSFTNIGLIIKFL